MCELLGMSANVPTDICFSFAGLIRRGGETGPHRDGWGIAFYEGRGLRAFHDPLPSADSRIAELLIAYPIKSRVVISHIRQANVGEICLANTHPFSRELWGVMWCFAHNGQLDRQLFDWPLTYYRPAGTTDSEYAFCWLLDQIRARYPDAPPQDPSALLELVHECCEKLRGLGVFNMLLSESTRLFCYCSTKLSWITRRAPFGEAHLRDRDMSVDFHKETTPNDVVTVIATEPLTDNEQWQRLAPGAMVVFVDGEVERQLDSPDRAGH
ncbi:class II glutamine amidotransferase [Marinobacterium sp. D7]|uniref:class II glutamine amidotransferase n=1 Tax=Marinobacterium ramblicola TaxID=2849041 RepID=UPI001C2CDB2C|nr:class II glutamine amidotransferase [Marinobacterium ramblicola]MBV1789534.1 class II glutamine amidotransferase [Marinobacterium ramblicola]